MYSDCPSHVNPKSSCHVDNPTTSQQRTINSEVTAGVFSFSTTKLSTVFVAPRVKRVKESYIGHQKMWILFTFSQVDILTLCPVNLTQRSGAQRLYCSPVLAGSTGKGRWGSNLLPVFVFIFFFFFLLAEACQGKRSTKKTRKVRRGPAQNEFQRGPHPVEKFPSENRRFYLKLPLFSLFPSASLFHHTHVHILFPLDSSDNEQCSDFSRPDIIKSFG